MKPIHRPHLIDVQIFHSVHNHMSDSKIKSLLSQGQSNGHLIYQLCESLLYALSVVLEL